LYRLVGAANDPAGWERTLVDHDGTHEARAIDLNGDGWPDIAGGEENTDLVTPPRNGQVSWWENTTGAAPTTTSTTTLPGGARQVTLHPDPTTGIDNQMAGIRNATSNYGAASFLCVGNDQANSERVLIHFDLSSLGSMATVTSCALTVTVNQVTAPTSGRILRLRRNDWSEGGSSWSTVKSGASWTAPGAADTATDVDATSAVSFAPPSSPGAYTFPAMIGLCQDAVTNHAGALDLLIRQDVDQDGACTGGCASHEFCSRSSDYATPAARPTLTVTYAAGGATTSTTTTSPAPTTSTTASPTTTVVASSSSITTTTGGPSTTLQLTIQPDATAGIDNQLAGGRNTTANYGTGSFLCVGNDQSNSERVLLHYDLSALGAQASVTSCLLTLSVNQVTEPTLGKIMRLRRNDWSETGSSWVAYKTGAAWTAPGASDETSDVDTVLAISFAPPAAAGSFTFPPIQALCQDAVRNRTGSLDLVVRGDADQDGACAGACVAHEFCSRSSDYATAAARPKLVVGYVP
jgi:hypothetical protein